MIGNVTSGWVTSAQGSNSTANATIQYIVLTTNNTSSISSSLGGALLPTFHVALNSAITGTEKRAR